MKLSKIMKIKGIGFILLAFAAGVILLLMPEAEESKGGEKSSAVLYVSSLEEALEELLEEATGHKCAVMLTLETGYSYAYAVNEKLDTAYGENGMTSKSVSKEYVTVSDGGKESLVIIREEPPSVKGVAVVCKKGNGADRDRIISMVASLFDLPYENVSCITGSGS
jgi:stage III sporulation protein AG